MAMGIFSPEIAITDAVLISRAKYLTEVESTVNSMQESVSVCIDSTLLQYIYMDNMTVIIVLSDQQQ